MPPLDDPSAAPEEGKGKPRLFFVTGSTDDIEEYFYLSAVRPWVEGLGKHFVVAEPRPGDPIEAQVEAFAPDLILFFGAKHKLLYAGPPFDFRARFGVPVAALSLMDAHSPAKSAFFDQSWGLGVEAVFTIDTGMREIAGEFAPHVYYCPWFVNHAMSRDFGEPKTIPVALIGDGFVSTGDDWRYPWRRAVAERLRAEFTCFTSPRPAGKFRHRMVGEEYGRMLNRSWLALSCGAARQIFMKKDLEIPASRSCLVTERNPALIHLGFRDMENCVFVEPDNVAEKCRALLADPDRLMALTDRGRAFVLRHHDAAHRRVLRDWLALRGTLRPGERIVQTDVLGPLQISRPGAELAPVLLSGESPFIRHLRAARDAWGRGDWPGVAEAAASASALHSFTAEPAFLLALAALADGRPAEAFDWLQQILRRCLHWGSGRPDPVLWSAYLVAASAVAPAWEIAHLTAAFPGLHHPALDRVRAELGRAVEPVAGRATPTILDLPGDLGRDPAAFFLALLDRRSGRAPQALASTHG